MRFIEVILPIPLPGTFTYSYSELTTSQPQIGARVIVQFGKRKIYTGIVAAIHDRLPKDYQPKEIMDLVDEFPIITPTQLRFFEWISKYYMCSIGEVMNAALPAGLKISSESYLSLNPDINLEELELAEKEKTVVRHLLSGDIKLNDVAPILDIKSPYNYVKKLKEKNVIQVFEQVKDKYSPKKETWLKLNDVYTDEEALEMLCDSLESKQKQLEVVLAYIRQVPIFESPSRNETGISKKALLNEGVSTSSLRTLTKKNFFIEWEKIISRLDGILDQSENQQIELSAPQAKAENEILTSFEKHATVLLHGITGSGKTEIYISLIQKILSNGGQVLYLLPEIALTTQIIKRLSKVFGESFGVFHSRYSDNERVEVWQKVQKGAYNFVVGVRSAIFLPFTDLSLIIIDEEHEPSFKQHEPAPRYHARDAAIYLSSMFHSKTLLGTATPALETYHNALEGKYGLVQITERYGSVSLPKVSFANLITERKQNKMKGIFSHTLLTAIRETLDQNKQVILFQNKRGYAPYVTCHNCGYIPKCPHCDVSLTYHSYQNLLVCHYCGYKTDMLTECLQCQSTEIKTMSFGTEKIEEELEIMIPEARVRRMDLDSTRSKYSYQKIIDEFENREIDILVGTQMVSKGLDFGGVELVGVFDADRIIHFPDFRSHERAYQLIHQVSGRAGRRNNQGKVIIQTNDPDQPLLQRVKHQDYLGFYQNEILERAQFHYPPFHRFIKITFKDADKQIASDAARFYSIQIRKQLSDNRVNGPVEPLIGKIRNLYLYEIFIKIEKQGINLTALKEFLLNSRNILLSERSYKSVRVIFDVDSI